MYVFKAGYHRRYGPANVWRQLAVPDETSLDALTGAVLRAFDFKDDEHLYDWTVKNRSGRKRSFVHPMSEPMHETDGYADEITVGELDLPDKAKLDFRFDYGHTWRFELRLERVDPPDPALKGVAQTISKGKSLPQYPNYAEE